MKTYLVLFVQIAIASCKVIPEYVPQPCLKSNPNYTDCTLHVLHKLGPYLLKGIPELKSPKLHPLQMPFFEVNHTYGECSNYSLRLRNTEIWGINTTTIRDFTFDPEDLRGEVDLRIEHLRLKAEYEIDARFSSFSYKSGGKWCGNTTGINLNYPFSLKEVERDGVTYYQLDDFDRTVKIEGGHVNVTSKYPDRQFIADLFMNFFNEDPKRALQVGNFLFRKNVLLFYRSIVDRILGLIPAQELLPS